MNRRKTNRQKTKPYCTILKRRIVGTYKLLDFGLKPFCCTFCSAVLRYMIDFTYTVPYYIKEAKFCHDVLIEYSAFYLMYLTTFSQKNRLCGTETVSLLCRTALTISLAACSGDSSGILYMHIVLLLPQQIFCRKKYS